MADSPLTILQELGHGTFSQVYYAEQDSQPLALKVPARGVSLEEEIAVLSTLKHPNIVGFLGVVPVARGTSRALAVALEYMASGDLLEHIDPERGLRQPELAQPLFEQVLRGVAYLHAQGLVHRDLKCENILLQPDLTVKLTDFGFTAAAGALRPAQGTPPYSAPELLAAPKHADIVVAPAQDVWALGVILYVMLLGAFPWKRAALDNVEYQIFLQQGPSEHPRWQPLVPSMRAFVHRFLQPEAACRWSVATALKVLQQPAPSPCPAPDNQMPY